LAYVSVGLTLTGCASYQSRISAINSDLRQHRAADAAKKLEPKAEKEGDDQVVYLFEYATALQMAGQFKESNKAFLKVDDLTEIKDYHSLSRIAGSLLLSEGMIQYKGEDYEKVLINALAAINFIMENDFENALVMSRRLNDKLYKYKYEAKRNYEQNAFAFYLMALLWEDTRDWDSAYIQFKKTFELNPNLKYLGADLIRAAKNAQRDEDLAEWKKKFPGIKVPDQKNTGEVILIYQQGWAPNKKPDPSFPRVPKLYPTVSNTSIAELEFDNGVKERSDLVFSVQDIAIKELDDAYAELIAKRAAGIAAKAVVADQIRQKNQGLGELAWLAMNAADQADLRQWSSLPATFQIAKVRLPPGKYKVKIIGLRADATPSGEFQDWREIEVHARKKTFLNWRSVE
jgi:hypothetical protein